MTKVLHRDGVGSKKQPKTAAVEVSDTSFETGYMFAGRFRVVRWIASGGMGEVYEAHDCELDKRIAIKVIRQEIAADKGVMGRFRREIALAQNVTHKSVCRIFDIFYHSLDEAPLSDAVGFRHGSDIDSDATQDTVAFLTMELLNGQTLDDRLRLSGPFTVDEALPIVRQLLEALAAAHEVGIIHRDLKCSNVVLIQRPQGVRAVITDFGLARNIVKRGDSSVTGVGEIVGSPAYMAPEQATDEPLTPATDLYTLGIVIFRMITGRLPFESTSAFTVLSMRLHEDAPSPAKFVENLDPRWEATILKCLQRESDDRFSSAMEVLAALEAEPSATPPPHRSPWNWTYLGAGSALLLCVAALIAWGLRPENGLQATDQGLRATSNQPVRQELWEDELHPPHSSSEVPHRHSVAVLGFKNLSASSDADWLSSALAELLTTELTSGEELRVVPGENVALMKTDLALPESESLSAQTLHAIGQRLDCEYVVFGSYFSSGESGDHRLRLDLRIQDTDARRTIKTLSETASENDLFALVNRLGSSLRTELKVPPAPSVANAGARTSVPSNPQAVKLYTQGLAALRQADFRKARDLLLEAVAIEPEYPLMHSALARAYLELGHDAEAAEQINIAYRTSEELPRQERQLIEAKFWELAREWDKAIQSYSTLFEYFPNNLEYGLKLMKVQIDDGHTEEAERTLMALQRIPDVADDPRISLYEAHLALASSQIPRALEASTLARRKSQEIGARHLANQALLEYGVALTRQNRLDEAAVAVDSAREAMTALGDQRGQVRAISIHGIILSRQGKRSEALALHQRALEISRSIGDRKGVERSLINQAHNHAQQGHLKRADRIFKEALAIARSAGKRSVLAVSLLNNAEISREVGKLSEAAAYCDEGLRIARQIKDPALTSLLLYASANIALVRGDIVEAERLYQDSLAISRGHDLRGTTSRTLISLGDVALIQGRLGQAKEYMHDALAQSREIAAEGIGNLATQRLALLAFEELQFTRAEALAAEAAEGFSIEERFAEEAQSLSLEALAQLGTERIPQARETLDRAKALTASLTSPAAKLQTDVVEARVLAAEGRNEDARILLDLALVEAGQIDHLHLQLDIRLAAGELALDHALARGPDAQADAAAQGARAQLRELHDDAGAHGFHLIASKANLSDERRRATRPTAD